MVQIGVQLPTLSFQESHAFNVRGKAIIELGEFAFLACPIFPSKRKQINSIRHQRTGKYWSRDALVLKHAFGKPLIDCKRG